MIEDGVALFKRCNDAASNPQPVRGQLVQQRLRVLQIRRIEAFGEPMVDRIDLRRCSAGYPPSGAAPTVPVAPRKRTIPAREVDHGQEHEMAKRGWATRSGRKSLAQRHPAVVAGCRDNVRPPAAIARLFGTVNPTPNL
jgi:hypothetical protein